MKYYPEIDGLRAVAVLLVLGYHLKIPLDDGYFLAGGFLGVDIFFAISGYIITGLILSEYDSPAGFSIKSFYIRRARRILPPLFLVIIFSIPCAYFIMMPGEALRFSQSIFASVFFYSNIFWYEELGRYGAQEGLLQPFLHTWSLAIEEQFYLLFPVAMLFLLRRSRARAVLILLAVAGLSLALAHATSVWRQDLSFFSPVSRAWELLMGSCLAFMRAHWPHAFLPRGRLSLLIPPLSLAVIVFSALTVQLYEVVHPGLVTLPAVAATCAMIWFARADEIITRALSSRALTTLGRLSYSIYLWHFPIFAFGRLLSVDRPDALDKTAWLVLTLAASFIGYHLVEKPFRFRIGGRAFAGATLAAALLIAGFAGTSATTDLLSRDRLSHLAALYGANEFDNERLRELTWGPLRALAGAEETASWTPHRPSPHEATGLWFEDSSSLKVLVVGNSHGRDLFNSLHLNADKFGNIEFARFGMRAEFPEEQRRALYDSPNFNSSDMVLIAPRYIEDSFAVLPDFITEMKEHGKRAVVVGNTVEFAPPSRLPVFDWYLRKHGSDADFSHMNKIAYEVEAADVSARNERLRRIADRLGVPYLSRRSLVCTDREGLCRMTSPDGRKTMFDYGHWTVEGAEYFGVIAAETGWLPTGRGVSRKSVADRAGQD